MAAVELLGRMAQTLKHESFYATGTWIDEEAGVYVAWTGLEGSCSGESPLRNYRGDVVLAFSGEEFSSARTAQELKHPGDVSEDRGSSYLVQCYDEDPSFPAKLNGRFHGVLVDRRTKRAVVFNDRYGLRRLYVYESGGVSYFAAEAKAILAVCPETRTVDPDSLGEFVSCGCVLENRTLFRGIQVLPPGSAWTFRNGSADERRRYFHPQDWEEQPTLSPECFYEELRRTFIAALPRYFTGDQRIAMSLTGGLDTRMIMAWQRCLPPSLPCYTFGGMRRDCQDVIVAREVARVCAQPHQVIGMGRDFFADFPRLAERTVYLTDGCADVSRAADLYLNGMARGIAPVRLTGVFGGEILRGVRAFKAEETASGLFDGELSEHVNKAKATYARLVRGHPVSFAAFKQATWHHYGVLGLEETQLSIRTPFLDNDLVRTAFRAPKSARAGDEMSLRLIGDGNEALLQIPTDRGVGGSRGRFREAVSRGLLGLLFKGEYAYDMGMPQWMAHLDHATSPLRLERLFLGRHKIFHFRTWYRDALSRYIREVLLDSRSLSRPYIVRQGVEALISGHIKGDRNYTVEIHKLLTLEFVHRLLLEASGARSSPGPSATALSSV